MLMAIATPPQRMGPGVEEHELIALVEAHLAIIALARPMRLKSSWGWEDAGVRPFVGARVDFRVDELLRYGDAIVLPA